MGVVQTLDLRAARWPAHQVQTLADGINGDALGGGINAASEFHQGVPDVIAVTGFVVMLHAADHLHFSKGLT